MPRVWGRERERRGCPDGPQIHPFRLHEGEFARSVRTDEVLDWMAGTATGERSLLLVIHDQYVVGLVGRQAFGGGRPAMRIS
jgi:hypothetical protein